MPRLIYIVTEDWYFVGHRLPMAQAAQSAGFDVHVVTRVKEHGDLIRSLGFTLHPIEWSRGSTSPADVLRSIMVLRRLVRRIEPDVVHNVALKPAILGSLACVTLPIKGIVNSINGLGSAFLASSMKGKILQRALGTTLPLLFNAKNVVCIVQNPDDMAALQGLGVRDKHLVLIPGSGVDTEALRPVAEPEGGPIRVGFVGRMLEDKGVRPLVEAFRILRRNEAAIELVLAGTPDPENHTSITEGELHRWSTEPGISWIGHCRDIQGFWAQNHIAVLPSRREGLPKSLLEAAACGRPMVATDAPGCREVAIDGRTGLLVPIDDPPALAQAIRILAADRNLRLRFGQAARELAEQQFSSVRIGRQTSGLYAAMARKA